MSLVAAETPHNSVPAIGLELTGQYCVISKPELNPSICTKGAALRSGLFSIWPLKLDLKAYFNLRVINEWIRW